MEVGKGWEGNGQTEKRREKWIEKVRKKKKKVESRVFKPGRESLKPKQVQQKERGGLWKAGKRRRIKGKYLGVFNVSVTNSSRKENPDSRVESQNRLAKLQNADR